MIVRATRIPRCRARWRRQPQLPSDDVVGNSGIFHGSRQMAGHRGEVFTVDAEAFVGLRERAAVVLAEYPAPASQKHLVSLESSYVDPSKYGASCGSASTRT